MRRKDDGDYVLPILMMVIMLLFGVMTYFMYLGLCNGRVLLLR